MNCSGTSLKTLRAISRAAFLLIAMGLSACDVTAPEPQTTKEAKLGFKIAQSYLADHPSKIWAEAASYLEAGDMDQATLWFYAGQLRYRVWLDCPEMKAEMQDLIVFSAQFETMEPKINGWAAQNLERFVDIVDAVLAWDDANANTPPLYGTCAESRLDVRRTYDNIRSKAVSQR